jgi:hypothetical protein
MANNGVPQTECTCQEFENQFEDLWNGRIHGKARLRLETHMVECRPCSEHYQTLRLLEQTPSPLWPNGPTTHAKSDTSVARRPAATRGLSRLLTMFSKKPKGAVH